MTITTTYSNGQIVYLLTDREQQERIITCIQIAPGNSVSYQLSCGSQSSWHYECEIVSNQDVLKALR